MRLSPHAFTLRQLQYVVVLAETGSFRRAAERCRVAQPSLSAQIAEIESHLGTRLFERSSRGVTPTAAGAEIVEHATRVLRAAEELVDVARRAADPFRASVRIGVIPTLGPYLLPRITPHLAALGGELTLLWVEERTAELVHRLAERDIDAAILALPAELPGLEVRTLARDPFVLATCESHPLGSASGRLSLEALEGEQVLLLDEGHCLRDQVRELCSRTHIGELAFRATSLSTLVQMVASGTGITLLPRIAVETERLRAALRIRELAPPAPSREIAIAWRPRSPAQPVLEALATAVATALAGSDESAPGAAYARRARGAAKR